MKAKPTQHDQSLKQFVNDNRNSEEVISWLNQIGVDDEMKLIYLKEFKQLRNKRRLSLGVTFIITGAVIGFVSCVLTITNPFPNLYNAILFGLTSLAIIVAFIGLYLIFE